MRAYYSPWGYLKSKRFPHSTECNSYFAWCFVHIFLCSVHSFNLHSLRFMLHICFLYSLCIFSIGLYPLHTPQMFSFALYVFFLWYVCFMLCTCFLTLCVFSFFGPCASRSMHTFFLCSIHIFLLCSLCINLPTHFLLRNYSSFAPTCDSHSVHILVLCFVHFTLHACFLNSVHIFQFCTPCISRFAQVPFLCYVRIFHFPMRSTSFTLHACSLLTLHEHFHFAICVLFTLHACFLMLHASFSFYAWCTSRSTHVVFLSAMHSFILRCIR